MMHRIAISLSRRKAATTATRIPTLSSFSSLSSKRTYSVYSWGTSTNGTIPHPEILDEEQKVVADGGGGGMLGQKRNHVIDHPRELDTNKAFGENSQVTTYHCGNDSTAAILSDNKCLVWGSNDKGQLGLGHTNEVLLPTQLYPPPSESISSLKDTAGIKSLELGKPFSAAIDTDGNLHTFGYGGSPFDGMGWLGHGNDASHLEPTRVESLFEDGCEAKDVKIGESHMTVLTTEGEVLTAGSGAYGRLGNLETDDQLFLEPVELLGGMVVNQIVGGLAFTLALTDDGVIHGWGRNDKGQLGTGGGLMVDMYAMSSMPTPIEAQLEGRTVVKVAAGHSHSAAITDKGELFVWGMNQFLEPQLMNTMLHTKCVDVVCGQNYTMVLTEDNEIYSMGKGKTGVLGHANNKKKNSPELVEGLVGQEVTSMSAGYTHFACLVGDRP